MSELFSCAQVDQVQALHGNMSIKGVNLSCQPENQPKFYFFTVFVIEKKGILSNCCTMSLCYLFITIMIVVPLEPCSSAFQD